MSGELVLSQFRYSVTNNRDFVIGDPTDANLDQAKYLVFQMTDIPGYSSNPHIKAEKVGGSWKISFSEDGSTALNLAYVDKINTFLTDNTFEGVTTFSGNVIGDTATFNNLLFTTATASGNVHFLNDVIIDGSFTVSGASTQLNVASLTVKDKNIIFNATGSTAGANGAGISIVGDASAVIAGITLETTDWAFYIPGRTSSLNLRPPTGAAASSVIAADYLTTVKAFQLPQSSNASNLIAVFSNKAQVSDITNSRVVVTDTSGGLLTTAITATEAGYLSGVTSNIQSQLNSKWTGTGGDISGSFASIAYVDQHLFSYTVTNSPTTGKVPYYNGTNITWINEFISPITFTSTGAGTTFTSYSVTANAGDSSSYSPNGIARYGYSESHITDSGDSELYENFAYLEIQGQPLSSAGITSPGLFNAAIPPGVLFSATLETNSIASAGIYRQAIPSFKLGTDLVDAKYACALELQVQSGTGTWTSSFSSGATLIMPDVVTSSRYALYFKNGVLTQEAL